MTNVRILAYGETRGFVFVSVHTAGLNALGHGGPYPKGRDLLTTYTTLRTRKAPIQKAAARSRRSW